MFAEALIVADEIYYLRESHNCPRTFDTNFRSNPIFPATDLASLRSGTFGVRRWHRAAKWRDDAWQVSSNKITLLGHSHRLVGPFLSCHMKTARSRAHFARSVAKKPRKFAPSLPIAYFLIRYISEGRKKQNLSLRRNPQ